MEFSRPEYWSGQPFPSPGDLPNTGIKPRSPTLQADSLSVEPQKSPRILEWVVYPFSSRSYWLRNQARVFCIAGGFFTNWAIREVQTEVTQLCLTLCDPLDCTVHGIWNSKQKVTIYSLDILFSQFGTSPLFHVQIYLLLLDLHTDFSGGR